MCTYITKTSYIQSKGELHEKWKYAAAVLSTCLYTYINTDIQVRLRGNGSCELKSLPTDLTKMIEAITYSNRLMHVYNRETENVRKYYLQGNPQVLQHFKARYNPICQPWIPGYQSPKKKRKNKLICYKIGIKMLHIELEYSCKS